MTGDLCRERGLNSNKPYWIDGLFVIRGDL